MLSKANGNEVIDKFEKSKRLESAAKYYGLFLESLGFDYEADPQTIDVRIIISKFSILLSFNVYKINQSQNCWRP